MSLNVKITTKLNPFDLLAPHSCRGCGDLGSPLCECCKNYIIKNRQNFCPRCKHINPSGNCRFCSDLPPIFIVDVRTNLIGTLIHDYKYNSVRALKNPLAELLNTALPPTFTKSPFHSSLKANSNIIHDDDSRLEPKPLSPSTIIVPLPTSLPHIRTRAFDHTLKLAESLAKLRGFRVEPLLVRNKNTVQVGTDSKTRKTQAASAYKIAKNVSIDKEATYLLLDDVWTTGASMESALKKLHQTGIKNIVVGLLAVNSLN